MTKILDRLSEALLPSSQELWDNAGAEMREWNGTEVPFFDLEISDPEELYNVEFETKRRQRRLGREVLYKIDVNGVDHLARVFDPYEEYRTDVDFTITSGAAFTTTIDGYALDRAKRLFADTQQPHIQVSAPHSANELGWWDFLRLPETIAEARLASLALAAQTEQRIIAKLSDKHGFSLDQVPIGDSRDSITIPGQYPYAHWNGARIIDFDAKARCSLEQDGIEDIPGVIVWTLETVIGGVGVGMCLAKEGELGTLKGTTSLNPNFIASSMTGTLRGLASDEPRRMMGWAPRLAHGLDIIYGKDSRVDPEAVRAAWQNHPNIYMKLVEDGRHPSLLHPKGRSPQRDRMKRRVDQQLVTGGDPALWDWNYVYNVDPTIWTPYVVQHEAA